MQIKFGLDLIWFDISIPFILNIFPILKYNYFSFDLEQRLLLLFVEQIWVASW